MKLLQKTICLLFFICISAVQGQTAAKDQLMNDYHYVQSKVRPTAEEIGNIEGSPYYRDTFQEAFLHFEGRDPVPAKIRYNVVKEEMQVLYDPNNFQILHDGITVELDQRPFQKFSYTAEDKGVNLLGYFEVLTEDYEEKPLVLLQKHYKEVKEGVKKARMQRAFPSKYVEESDFYVKFNNSTKAVLVPRNKNDFLDLFPAQSQDKIQTFMKENKLKSKDAEDLMTVVNYYNSNF